MAVRIKRNDDGWRQLRISDPVQDHLLKLALAGKEAADRWIGETDGFKVVKERGTNRARYTVRPNTPHATAKVAKDPAGFIDVVLTAARSAS